MKAWSVEFHDSFDPEFDVLDQKVREVLLMHLVTLRERGSQLGRPLVDTLNGSTYPNMKEMRFRVGRQVWRTAFAFDPERKGIILVAANKQGKDQKKFYAQLIKTADIRYSAHLETLNKKGT